MGGAVVLPLRRELPRPGRNDDRTRRASRSHHYSHRWVQKYAPELDKQTRRSRQVPDWQARSWRVDKTYIRVGGKWCYLYRAVTAGGHTLDFYLSPKRNVAAAKCFLAKTLRSNASAGSPRVINTDKAPSLAKAISSVEGGRHLSIDGRASSGEIPQQCH
ncbi:hypothetical protein HMPREF0290_0595 [Corynebacterium efficiens YS-314]|uniref:Putative transposase n=1 Tax=Corynebacterium efficiens (strain DSM 44549 / YS-314 / AJ 12310 / JCM 11189 / NBRC 100395) TaxID=196164 RepID=Q8FLF0_COREF|nr:hypothetical protein HMPREF0290_0595 [Corynebacterium efficiens YS-314]BAC19807.1 putative transposase [Corynebacterium efficiens YS-314]